MNEKNSLKDLESTLRNIGEDISYLYDGMRANWWEAKQIATLSTDPSDKPSKLVFCNENNKLCVDDNQPMFALNSSRNALFVWIPAQMSWTEIPLTSNKISTVNKGNKDIILYPATKTYFLEVDSDKNLTFNLALLQNQEDVAYNFEMIFDIKKQVSISIPKEIKWASNKKPSFSSGKTYIMYLKVINNIILGTFEEY